MRYLAPGGRLNIFAGIYPKDQVHLDPNQIHYGEWIITGSADSTPENMHRALTLIESGQVQTEALISDILPCRNWPGALRWSRIAQGSRS